jgi:hypothetical protein
LRHRVRTAPAFGGAELCRQFAQGGDELVECCKGRLAFHPHRSFQNVSEWRWQMLSQLLCRFRGDEPPARQVKELHGSGHQILGCRYVCRFLRRPHEVRRDTDLGQ